MKVHRVNDPLATAVRYARKHPGAVLSRREDYIVVKHDHGGAIFASAEPMMVAGLKIEGLDYAKRKGGQ